MRASPGEAQQDSCWLKARGQAGGRDPVERLLGRGRAGGEGEVGRRAG